LNLLSILPTWITRWITWKKTKNK